MTARWGRVNTIALSAVFGGVGSILFAVAPSYLSLFRSRSRSGWRSASSSRPTGRSWRTSSRPSTRAGTWASRTPSRRLRAAGRGLGGPLADLINSWRFGLGYRAIFVLAAVEFVIGAAASAVCTEPDRGVG